MRDPGETGLSTGAGSPIRIVEPLVAAPRRILVLSGELDVHGARGLSDSLDRALEAGVEALVVDLRDVTFMDSLSLAALVAAKRRLEPQGRLAVVVADSYADLILAASGLKGVLDVFADPADAESFAFASL